MSYRVYWHRWNRVSLKRCFAFGMCFFWGGEGGELGRRCLGCAHTLMAVMGFARFS